MRGREVSCSLDKSRIEDVILPVPVNGARVQRCNFSCKNDLRLKVMVTLNDRNVIIKCIR